MTFDYRVILSRILSCSGIVKRLKEQVKFSPIIYSSIDRAKLFSYLRNIKLDLPNEEQQLLDKNALLRKQLETLTTVKPLAISDFTVTKQRVKKMT